MKKLWATSVFDSKMVPLKLVVRMLYTQHVTLILVAMKHLRAEASLAETGPRDKMLVLAHFPIPVQMSCE